MKTLAQRTYFWFVFMLVILLTAGCGQFLNNTITPSPQPASSATATLTPLPTNTPSPTAFPTLPVEQAHAKLLELLANNGNCRLPCFWGITPGKSTYQEARAVWEPLSGISDLTVHFTPNQGVIFPIYTEGDLRLFTSASFLFDNQVVSRIHLQAGQAKKIMTTDGEVVSVDSFDSKIFGEQVYPYTLSQILSEHGIPAAVLITTDGGIDRGKNVPGFGLWLFYPDQGIFVAYTTNRQLINGTVRGCPTNAHVELELYPSDVSSSEFLEQTPWESSWPLPAIPYDEYNVKSIENATSMSLKQFYETFRHPTDKCIETPIDGWGLQGR